MLSNGLDTNITEDACQSAKRTERTFDEFTDSSVFAYNTSCHESTHYTPFEVMFGHKLLYLLMWI